MPKALEFIQNGENMFKYYLTITWRNRLSQIAWRHHAGVIQLLLKKEVKWTVLENVFIWPLAWYAAQQWLHNFAFRIAISWLILLIAGMLAFIISLLTVSYQSIKAALANPVESLRYE